MFDSFEFISKQGTFTIRMCYHVLKMKTLNQVLHFHFFYFQFSWFPEESNQYSTDLMARALMDSTIFVVFISTSYAEDRSCTDIFKYAKLTLGKPMVVVVVGEDNYSWRKTNLGLLLPDVVSDRKCINSHLTGAPLPLLHQNPTIRCP